MEEFDFSIDGMIKMQLPPSDTNKIHRWLMYETSKVKNSLLDNLEKNPENGMKLIRNFGYLVKKHVFITDKQVFLERWNIAASARVLFDLARKRINKSLVDELNNYIWDICNKAEEELFEAYQDQKIDPVKRQIEIRDNNTTPFEYFLDFEKKDELIMILKNRFPICTGVACARMIIALQENKVLKLPIPNQLLYNAIKNEWRIQIFNEWGVSKKIKKYWDDINPKWYETHKTKIQYTHDILIEIEYLKNKINDL